MLNTAIKDWLGGSRYVIPILEQDLCRRSLAEAKWRVAAQGYLDLLALGSTLAVDVERIHKIRPKHPQSPRLLHDPTSTF